MGGKEYNTVQMYTKYISSFLANCLYIPLSEQVGLFGGDGESSDITAASASGNQKKMQVQIDIKYF